jgi:pimeloyl-ACP methyl ester carboxylesterase
VSPGAEVKRRSPWRRTTNRQQISSPRPVVAGLRELTAPVVAINPDARPTDIQALRRHGVRTVLVSGVGHFLMMEDPDRFNRLLGEVIEEFRG